MTTSEPVGPYSKEFLEHLTGARGQGTLDAPTHRGVAVDGVCGDRLTLELRVEDATVRDAKFCVEGCPGAIAVGSALAALAPGRRAVAEGISALEIDTALGGVPRSKRHALRLAVETWKSAVRTAVP